MLQVLCGPIASGKSSYCKNAAQAGFLIVNDDSIVNMLHADIYTLYDKNLKILYKSIENHAISTALAMGKCVVVDRGLNCSISGRQRWIALAKSFDVGCDAIVFKNEGPKIHAERRSKSDDRGHDYEYWLKVAQAHQSNYKEPAVEEGFDNIHYVNFEEIKKGKFVPVSSSTWSFKND